MTIDDAIERLQGSLDRNTILVTRGDKDALRLGIEALKQLNDWRKGGVLGLDEPLLGETENKE